MSSQVPPAPISKLPADARLTTCQECPPGWFAYYRRGPDPASVWAMPVAMWGRWEHGVAWKEYSGDGVTVAVVRPIVEIRAMVATRVGAVQDVMVLPDTGYELLCVLPPRMDHRGTIAALLHRDDVRIEPLGN